MLYACAIFVSMSLLATAAPAAPAAAGERGRIEAEMQRLTSAFAAEETACKQRFVVTSCIEDVQLRRREALAALRSQLLALDDEDRRQRASARLAAIEAKLEARRDSVPQAQPEPRQPVDRAPPRAASPSASVPLTAVRRDQAATARQEAASAAAAQRVAAAKRRQQQAELHAEQVRRRLLERERSGKAAAPLPVPAASR